MKLDIKEVTVKANKLNMNDMRIPHSFPLAQYFYKFINEKANGSLFDRFISYSSLHVIFVSLWV